ncbi:MAG: hypothetical protein AB8H80_06310 [Planctomycetota bacterium]
MMQTGPVARGGRSAATAALAAALLWTCCQGSPSTQNSAPSDRQAGAGDSASSRDSGSGQKQNRPPVPGQVRDGTSLDLDQQASNTSLFANWDAFVDPDGLPVVYQWGIGTAKGDNNIVGWQDVGGSLNGAISNADLPKNTTLFVNVRAIDVRGNRSATASSDGILLAGTEQPTPARTREPASGSDAASSRANGAIADEAGATPAGPPAGPKAADREGRANTSGQDADSWDAGNNWDAGKLDPGRRIQIERHGITWRFARPARCGRYATGDWWVKGPVDILVITPQSNLESGRVRNGSMINPSPRAVTQGYDSAMFGGNAPSRFDPALNVAFEVSPSAPLRLMPGSSLVSTVSHSAIGQLPQLAKCAVLTCVRENAPRNAFRPPYCGTDKRPRWTAEQLDLTVLAQLEPEAGAPDLASLVARFERTWLDHLPGYTGRYLHPSEHMPDYGRELADLVSQAALALQLDVPASQKRPLAIAMVQLGIDSYGIVQNGGRFLADGGSGSGRKFPLLLAGAMLHDDALLRWADASRTPDSPAFAEDAQTFYVLETAPGVLNGGHGGYVAEDVDMPEWGNRHADEPGLDRKAWAADPYRRCCTANVWHGYVLAARIMGLRDQWGHPALFDYVDRYMQNETRGHWMRSWNPFCERMWDRYRPLF